MSSKVIEIMDVPKFEPWSQEIVLTENGFEQRELYRVPIKVRKGDVFMPDNGQKLRFYIHTGGQMEAEIRGCQSLTLGENYNRVNLLVFLTPEQVGVLFPHDYKEPEIGY